MVLVDFLGASIDSKGMEGLTYRCCKWAKVNQKSFTQVLARDLKHNDLCFKMVPTCLTSDPDPRFGVKAVTNLVCTLFSETAVL